MWGCKGCCLLFIEEGISERRGRSREDEVFSLLVCIMMTCLRYSWDSLVKRMREERGERERVRENIKILGDDMFFKSFK